MPSLDHIQPKSRNGGWELDNLQILTWFENRAKAEMTSAEWIEFRKTNNIKCDLFAEQITNARMHINSGDQHREGTVQQIDSGRLPGRNEKAA